MKAHGVTNYRVGKHKSSSGLVPGLEFQPGTPHSKWWELHGFELDVTTAAPAANAMAPADLSLVDRPARRKTSGIVTKSMGSLVGGDKMQRLMSRGESFQRRQTVGGGVFPLEPLPPLEMTSAGKSTASDRKRSKGRDSIGDSMASRSLFDKLHNGMAEPSSTESGSMHRSRSLPTNNLPHAHTIRQRRSQKAEGSRRVLPSISLRDITDGQSREMISSTKLPRRDIRPRTTASMSTSTYQPLDKSVAIAAPSGSLSSRDLVSSKPEENVSAARRTTSSAAFIPATPREESDSEEYVEIGNGWSATFQMAGRLEAMMDLVYNGAKKRSESGTGMTPDESESAHHDEGAEQDGAYQQQDPARDASVDGGHSHVGDLMKKFRNAGKLAVGLASFSDDLRDAKRKRYLEAVYLSFGLHGKWEPVGISSPGSMKVSVVRLSVRNFEKLCKSAQLVNFSNLPSARVWSIFMAVSKGDGTIDFPQFLQALAAIASCTGRGIEHVHDAVAKVNKEKLLWIDTSAGDV